MVRGTVSLPHGTGKTARVIVFATGDQAEAARAAGADRVGSDDLIAEITDGFLDFDAAIATPDQMAKVGRIARVLGPRGPDAQPEDRHRDAGRRQGRRRHQGRQDQLPGGQAGEPAPDHRQVVVHARAAGGELRGRARRGDARQAVVGEGSVPEEDHVHVRRWVRASRSTPTGPATSSRTPPRGPRCRPRRATARRRAGGVPPCRRSVACPRRSRQRRSPSSCPSRVVSTAGSRGRWDAADRRARAGRDSQGMPDQSRSPRTRPRSLAAAPVLAIGPVRAERDQMAAQLAEAHAVVRGVRESDPGIEW